jgi:hypothetical protein
MARYIMGLAAQRGISPAHQRELAAAAYAESGLDPRSVNKSSGAAGLFQLLSSGYRSRAQQLGGLFNPRANTLAILGDYQRYWQQHPNAAPGEAGRDVERSGMGASFYANPLSMIPGGGGLAVLPPQGTAPSVPARTGAMSQMQIGQQIGRSLMAGRDIDWMSLARQQRQARTAALRANTDPNVPAGSTIAGTATPSLPYVAPGKGSGRGLAEAFYDPLGSWDNGRFGGPIGHHMDHVHLSITNPETMLYAIRQGQRMGLRVGENPYVDPVDPVHVQGSYHYRDFPGFYNKRRLGEAIDVSGDAAKMAAYYRWATGNLR